MSSPLVSTYKRLDVAFTHGEGVRLFDESGRPYLDALSGIAVCCLGHAHPRVTAAITEQAGRVIHTSNLYRIPTQERLAEALLRHCDLESVFFCNSGAEANEAAIKVARAYGLYLTLSGTAFLLGVGGLGVSIPSAPGNVGTLEGAYILALQMLGVGDSASRASFALTYHIVEWVTTCTIGLLCLGRLGFSLGQLAQLAERSPDEGLSYNE